MCAKKSKKYSLEPAAVSVVSENEYAYYTPTKPLINFWNKAGINVNINSDIDTLHYIKSGIKKSVLTKTMAAAGFSLEDMASILHTTDRTLRRYTEQTMLNTEQSERLIELAKLYNYGEAVFGNLDNFKIWMDSPIQALNNSIPKSFLDTSLGIQLITNCITRLEYGVYS
jgi:putative toxin-antitoxin system antitoxin component (TIGR02293 family)